MPSRKSTALSPSPSPSRQDSDNDPDYLPPGVSAHREGTAPATGSPTTSSPNGDDTDPGYDTPHDHRVLITVALQAQVHSLTQQVQSLAATVTASQATLVATQDLLQQLAHAQLQHAQPQKLPFPDGPSPSAPTIKVEPPAHPNPTPQREPAIPSPRPDSTAGYHHVRFLEWKKTALDAPSYWASCQRRRAEWGDIPDLVLINRFEEAVSSSDCDWISEYLAKPENAQISFSQLGQTFLAYWAEAHDPLGAENELFTIALDMGRHGFPAALDKFVACVKQYHMSDETACNHFRRWIADYPKVATLLPTRTPTRIGGRAFDALVAEARLRHNQWSGPGAPRTDQNRGGGDPRRGGSGRGGYRGGYQARGGTGGSQNTGNQSGGQANSQAGQRPHNRGNSNPAQSFRPADQQQRQQGARFNNTEAPFDRDQGDESQDSQ